MLYWKILFYIGSQTIQTVTNCTTNTVVSFQEIMKEWESRSDEHTVTIEQIEDYSIIGK